MGDRAYKETSFSYDDILSHHLASATVLGEASLSLKRHSHGHQHPQHAHHQHQHHHSIPRRQQHSQPFTVVDQQSHLLHPITASFSHLNNQQNAYQQRYQYLEGTVLLETSLPVPGATDPLRAPSSSSSGSAGTFPRQANGGTLLYRKPVYFEADGVGTCEEPPAHPATTLVTQSPVDHNLHSIHGSPRKSALKKQPKGGDQVKGINQQTQVVELLVPNNHCRATSASGSHLLIGGGVLSPAAGLEEQQFWGIPTPPGHPDPGDTAYYLQQRKSWSAPTRPRTPHHPLGSDGVDNDEIPSSSSTPEAMEPKHWLALVLVLLLALLVGVSVGVPLALRDTGNLRERLLKVEQLLKEVPLIDGHNDLAWNIRQFKQNQLRKVNFSTDLSRDAPPWSTSPWSQTDFVRLRKGHVGAQFWSAYAPCGSQDLNAVQITLEQIDVIKRFIQKYPKYLKLVHASHGIVEAQREGLIASLIGVEGGHSLGNSLGVLRMLHDLGTKYLSLTHSCDTPWAEADGPRQRSSTSTTLSSLMKKKVVGLTDFGKRVIREMNRLGMMVDLSHSSATTMRQALEESSAPVIFTHSGAQAVCNNSRNVPDQILRLLASKDGIIMVPFYPPFISCSSNASISDVIRHINHIRDVIGVDFIGIGSDFDGIDNLPKGLEDVSRYPYLLAELLSDPRWTDEDIKKVAGLNFLRVMGKVEKISEDLQRAGLEPEEHPISPTGLKGHLNCTFLGNR